MEPQDEIASPDEVLRAFTAMLRGEKTSEQMKAAENLAKHFGLLSPKPEVSEERALVAREIEAALMELEAARDGSERP